MSHLRSFKSFQSDCTLTLQLVIQIYDSTPPPQAIQALSNVLFYMYTGSCANHVTCIIPLHIHCSPISWIVFQSSFSDTKIRVWDLYYIYSKWKNHCWYPCLSESSVPAFNHYRTLKYKLAFMPIARTHDALLFPCSQLYYMTL